MVVISIPVKNYVKKYLVKRYGSIHKITKKSFIGLFLLEFLERKSEPPIRKKNDECCYDIQVPEFYFNNDGYYIDHVKLKHLGACLEKLFIEDFYNYVDTEMLKEKANARKSIRFFLSIYDIQEDELKLETIYRNYQRYSSESIKSKKYSKNIVTN